MNTSNLTTESRNQKTSDIDVMSIKEILTIMNEEDQKVAFVVKDEIHKIQCAVKAVIESFKKGGRLIYIGAGTSGRIGLLDAVECPPTFSTDFEMVRGLIAGGEKAFVKAVEGAEDSKELGEEDLIHIDLTDKDTVCGIAASGKTPYVIGALEYANNVGASTISISCNKGSAIGKIANIPIEILTGPEVLTGSTRLKAGSAQKMVVNMISTASMLGMGKAYKNLMIDLQPTNKKLIERSKTIIMEATGVDYKTADEYLEKSNKRPKIAIVMILAECDYEEAIKRLADSNGFVRDAIKE